MRREENTAWWREREEKSPCLGFTSVLERREAKGKSEGGREGQEGRKEGRVGEKEGKEEKSRSKVGKGERKKE